MKGRAMKEKRTGSAKPSSPNGMPDNRHPVTRRQVLLGGALLGVGFGSGFTVQAYRSSFFDKLVVTDYAVTLPQWPEHYQDVTIAFLSDLHVGCLSVGLDELRSIVEQVNALESDIILLGGDYLTHHQTKAWQPYIEPGPIAALLAPLRARLGVYSVLGNHDWYSDGPGMWRALEDNGIPVLENESVFIRHADQQGFWLAGLADYLTRKPDYAAALRETDDTHPVIALSHDPMTFAQMPGHVALQLSGHTHGGQVRLPLVGAVISPTPGIPREWFYGHVQEEQRQMIVSSGVGTSRLPFKNTPCEVVRVTISAEGDKRGGTRSALEGSAQNR